MGGCVAEWKRLVWSENGQFAKSATVQEARSSPVGRTRMKKDIPFLSMPVRGRRDALLVRHHARQVAHLLQFDAQEEACIAAGAFLIACQALERREHAQVHFKIDQNRLHVYAHTGASESPVDAKESDAFFRLAKPLPQGRTLEDSDIGWLVEKIQPSTGVFGEIVKQNQEVLALLSALHGASSVPADVARNPNAA